MWRWSSRKSWRKRDEAGLREAERLVERDGVALGELLGGVAQKVDPVVREPAAVALIFLVMVGRVENAGVRAAAVLLAVDRDQRRSGEVDEQVIAGAGTIDGEAFVVLPAYAEAGHAEQRGVGNGHGWG